MTDYYSVTIKHKRGDGPSDITTRVCNKSDYQDDVNSLGEAIEMVVDSHWPQSAGRVLLSALQWWMENNKIETIGPIGVESDIKQLLLSATRPLT